jgi:hypothetical protein
MNLRCSFGKQGRPRSSIWHPHGYDVGKCPCCTIELTKGLSLKLKAFSIDKRQIGPGA